MKSSTTSGTIVHTDRHGVAYRICALEYTVYEDETFRYVFTPDYDMIDLLPRNEFQGIPGLDLDLHLKQYVRENVEPVFITERTPGPNREDLYDLLESVGMTYLNRLEWAIRTDMRYRHDRLTVVRNRTGTGRYDLSAMKTSSEDYCRKALVAVGDGEGIVIGEACLDRSAYPLLCDVLRAALDSEESSKAHRGRGRTTARTTPMDIDNAVSRISNGEKAEDVAEELGISRATLYRRIRSLNGTTKR